MFVEPTARQLKRAFPFWGLSTASVPLALLTWLSCRRLSKIFSKPAEECFVPQLAILRFHHPMPFVRENQKFRRHSLELKRSEEFKALGIGHAKIHFAGA